MKRFSYFDAKTIEDAISVLKSGNTGIIAGGTDIINILKLRSRPNPPNIIVNIKNISGLDEIEENEDGLKIGSLTRLYEVEENKLIRNKYPLLSQAAHAVGSPQIRNMGTIAGNICQEPRCWYYRYPENVFYCLRKGGKECPAFLSENHFHSIFGAARVSDPPCQSNCPAKINISSYLNKLREGDLFEAAKILIQKNPIPAVTGRICPHFCQDECNRREIDESVSIRNIERFIGDFILENANELMASPEFETGCKIAIIGSGPAGLSAAYYLRKSGHMVTVFEQMERPGGMLAYGVPPYRLPREIVNRVTRAIEDMGVKFKLKVKVEKDISLSSIKKDFDAIFISTGAWVQHSIGLDGEHLTISGLAFLIGNLPPDFNVKGKSVLVIGGGNVAVDVGITAKRLGAKEVILACLESREQMPAFKWEVEQALEEGIKLMTCWGPSKVIQKENSGKIVELVCCRSVFDSEGNFCPEFDNSIREKLEVDEVLMAVGQKPDLSFLDYESSLTVKRGLIQVDTETQETGISGIFAGGDVVTGPASVISAIAGGRKAAIGINKLLGKGVPVNENMEFSKSLLSFNINYLRKIPSIIPFRRPVHERTIDEEDSSGISKVEAIEESNRCFNCGCLAVNPSDLAPALIALEAKIKTTKRTISAEDFFAVKIMKSTILEDDEIITGIEIPRIKGNSKQSFLKFRMRKTIDFPIVSVASALIMDSNRVSKARIALSGVAPVPIRSIPAEQSIVGKTINEENAEAAAEAAVFDSIPLFKNKYIVQIAKTLIKRSILACK